MQLYCVTQFIWPAFTFDDASPRMLYLGQDKKDALYFAQRFPAVYHAPATNYPQILCALPISMSRTVLRYHNRDNQWTSLVTINFEENTNG
jgi:hypothetical protein